MRILFVCGDRAGRTQKCGDSGDSEVRIFLWPVKPSAENARVGRTNVWSKFWWPGIARSHDMMAERQKLRENCKFEIIRATISHEMKAKRENPKDQVRQFPA